jgi:transcriptional regulator with XRE-family HTH domain
MSNIEASHIIVTRLNILRVQHGLTIQQMAERCGLPKSSLESYMKMSGGAKRPGLDALVAIANGMDVSIDWLVGRTEDGFSPKLTHREYALACFNAVVGILPEARGSRSNKPVDTPTPGTAVEDRDYALAAKAMFDFMTAIQAFQKMGPNMQRQDNADTVVDYFLKATGN